MPRYSSGHVKPMRWKETPPPCPACKSGKLRKVSRFDCGAPLDNKSQRQHFKCDECGERFVA